MIAAPVLFPVVNIAAGKGAVVPHRLYRLIELFAGGGLQAVALEHHPGQRQRATGHEAVVERHPGAAHPHHIGQRAALHRGVVLQRQVVEGVLRRGV